MFQKLYNHIFMHLAARFASDGRSATFTDGADTYHVEYRGNQPVSIRHASSDQAMRPGDESAPWARRAS